MRKHGYRSAGALVAGLLLLGAAWAAAQTPQTIALDGVNDFDPANLADNDSLDTQFAPIDIGEVYLTNDATKLYFGFDHDQDGWSQVQLGIAVDIGTAAGGTADPWGRQITWDLAANKPDFIFYVNLDNNWQAGYSWDGGAWVDMVTAGPGALGWVTGTAFKELGVLLSTLGVGAGADINVEMWVTQEGDTKGPLDAVASDADQLSTPTFTQWDVSFAIPLTAMLPYTVQAAADLDPPTVEKVRPRPSNDFPAESFFDVFFSEAVDQGTAENVANYAIGGGSGGAAVASATRDAGQPNIVHVALSAPLPPSGDLYQLTVTNVQDLAGNPIVADGAGNVACYMLKHVLFRGRMGQYLATNADPPDTFTVEGSLIPLSWALCDGDYMTDTGGDVYEYGTVFMVAGDCQAATADTTLEWKFVHDCSTYEPRSNRTHALSLAEGAYDTLDFWWNDEDPTQFTTHPIDVEFFVDMNVYGYAPTDTIGINGSEPPLNYDVPPTNELADDGVAPDAAAGDGIYAVRLRFPAGAAKNVTYKFLQNSAYECFAQGDRDLYLNDALFDTVGGALGPLTLPVVHYDRCTTSWRAVEVVFQVDFNNTAYENLQPGAVVAVNGTPSNVAPPTINWDVPSINPMRDDGLYPDAAAGDLIYATSVVFPDSSLLATEYKYLLNDEYECTTQGNRTFSLNPDQYDDAGNAQILAVDVFQRCTITDVVPMAGRQRPELDQNAPNPFNPQTLIRYRVPRAGQGSLRIYDARGRLVTTLLSGRFEAGEGSILWEGRNETGRRVGSGVYYCRLVVDGRSDVRSMVLIK